MSPRYAEQGEGGDRAWPIWGIATRVMQAVSEGYLSGFLSLRHQGGLQMGLHRDGEKWDLSSQELDDRRFVPGSREKQKTWAHSPT